MRKLGLLVVAAAIAAPTPTLAQTATDANGVIVDDVRETDDEDNDFPWGLLGLLGLAGLLGRKKHDRDVHVDARNDRRP